MSFIGWAFFILFFGIIFLAIVLPKIFPDLD